MKRANNDNSGRVYSIFNSVKKEPSLNVEKFNILLKCGNDFTKKHLNVCSAKEKLCSNRKYKEQFGSLCKSKGRRPVVN